MMKAPDPIAVALERLTYGIYVITISDGPDSHAMVATWATQVSFEPPILAISVEADSGARRMLGVHSPFTLHVLSSSDVEIAKHVLKHSLLPSAGTESSDETNLVQRDASREFLASLACVVEQQLVTGDHVVFFGRVLSAIVGEGTERPLTLHETGWKYRKRT